MKRNYKFLFLLFITAVIISGCGENNKTVKDFESSMNKIEEAIVSPADWTKAEIEVNKFKKVFNDHLWKMQLLGDENEYGRMKEQLLQLEAAIKSQDKTQTAIFISNIKTNLNSIFKGNKIPLPQKKQKKT